MSKNRFVCVHGHFYQPPRENPWLEAIEDQESAYPYPNWNARIMAECYRPNSAARIVDGDGLITRIINNYSRISFNFGPTLMSWLEREAPHVHEAVVDADRRSRDRYDGHGSACAQAYNHMIMPLASARDKRTQVVWGIRDFQRHFGRRPEGMWLPETAVDYETLDVLAEHGIQFTILAPYQAGRVRPLGGGPWTDVSGGRVDTGQVYRAVTPSGRAIDLFFYDGPAAQAVAFERLLADGVRFAERLTARPVGDEPVLCHIATDGETYGHHHRYGEMALAYALKHIEDTGIGTLTNYAQLRALAPARYEVDIVENTSWSCAHGVERWRSDCGCHTGARPEWNQAWRAPLREALDWLRDALVEIYERAASPLLRDPWRARDEYIDVIGDRSTGNVDRFFLEHAGEVLASGPRQRALSLLEMQRNAMLMYTSCGWFFDDVAGVENIQILRYAGRAIELAERVSGMRLEPAFLERLAACRSNDRAAGTGRDIYETHVTPCRVDLRKIVAHYAVGALFDGEADVEDVYCFRIRRESFERRTSGKASMIAGTMRATSIITGEERVMTMCALHLGEHNLTGGIRELDSAEAHRQMLTELDEAFDDADMLGAQRLIDDYFPEQTFSLRSFLPNHREQLVRRILEVSIDEVEDAHERMYSRYASLMRYLAAQDFPLPEAFAVTARFVIDRRLRDALDDERVNFKDIRAGFEQARRLGIELDMRGLGYRWQRKLERLADRFVRDWRDQGHLEAVTSLAELIASLEVDIDLWYTQNETYKMLRKIFPPVNQLALGGDVAAKAWTRVFTRLCDALRLRT